MTSLDLKLGDNRIALPIYDRSVVQKHHYQADCRSSELPKSLRLRVWDDNKCERCERDEEKGLKATGKDE